MNSLKKYLIKVASRWAKESVENYYNETKWEDEDAQVLEDYLSSESGKKFLSMLQTNSNRCLSGIHQKDKNVNDVRAESKAWLSIIGMLKLLSFKKKIATKDKLSDEKLEEIFSNIISNSSRVTNFNIR